MTTKPRAKAQQTQDPFAALAAAMESKVAVNAATKRISAAVAEMTEINAEMALIQKSVAEKVALLEKARNLGLDREVVDHAQALVNGLKAKLEELRLEGYAAYNAARKTLETLLEAGGVNPLEHELPTQTRVWVENFLAKREEVASRKATQLQEGREALANYSQGLTALKELLQQVEGVPELKAPDLGDRAEKLTAGEAGPILAFLKGQWDDALKARNGRGAESALKNLSARAEEVLGRQRANAATEEMVDLLRQAINHFGNGHFSGVHWGTMELNKLLNPRRPQQRDDRPGRPYQGQADKSHRRFGGGRDDKPAGWRGAPRKGGKRQN